MDCKRNANLFIVLSILIWYNDFSFSVTFFYHPPSHAREKQTDTRDYEFAWFQSLIFVKIRNSIHNA